MHKRILSTIVAVGVIFSVSSTVLATPLGEQLNQGNANVSQAEKKLEDLDKQMQILDNQVEITLKQKNDIDNQVAQIEKNIKGVQASIVDSENKISKEQSNYDQRIRAMYMNGKNEGYISMILGSKNFSELISNVEAIKKVTEYDKNLLSNLTNEKENIQNKKEKLATQKAKLQVLSDQDAKKLNDINATKVKVEALRNSADAELKKNKALVASLESQQNAQLNRIASLPSSNPVAHDRGGAPVPASANSIIQYASQFVGTPYVYGGSAPGGFDCSGFVQYVYAHFGVSLPRTTYGQVNCGSTVSSLQPGDLLFFGSPSAPYHVAMYAGDGYMIEAPRTGENVHIVPVRGYSIAKRVD